MPTLKVPILFVGSTLDRLNLAVGFVLEFHDLEAAEPGDAVAGNAVVMEEIPFALVLHDAVVGGPSHYRSEEDALIGERSVRIVADGVAEEMGVTGRV